MFIEKSTKQLKLTVLYSDRKFAIYRWCRYYRRYYRWCRYYRRYYRCCRYYRRPRYYRRYYRCCRYYRRYYRWCRYYIVATIADPATIVATIASVATIAAAATIIATHISCGPNRRFVDGIVDGNQYSDQTRSVRSLVSAHRAAALKLIS